MAWLVITAGMVAVASASEGVTLVQLKAERIAYENKLNLEGESKDAFPDISQLFPSKVFSTMKAKIEALEHWLTKVQQQDVAALANQKRMYEGRLSARQRENRELKRANKQIARRTHDVRKSNAALRNKSRTLAEANEKLVSELLEIQANLSLAQEFLQQGLVAVEKEAPEVHVLAELAEMDEVAAKALEKQARLNEIGGGSSDLSLLEFSGPERKKTHSQKQPEDSPGALMQVLTAHMAQLAKEQNTSETSLRQTFEKQMKKEIWQHAVLLEEQTQLNKSTAEALVLHQRLSSAVKHLSNVHKALLARRKAIMRFAIRLGANGEHVRQKRRGGRNLTAITTIHRNDHRHVAKTFAHAIRPNKHGNGTKRTSATPNRDQHHSELARVNTSRLHARQNVTASAVGDPSGEKWDSKHALVARGRNESHLDALRHNGNMTMPSPSGANRSHHEVHETSGGAPTGVVVNKQSNSTGRHGSAHGRSQTNASSAVPKVSGKHV